MYIKFLNYVQAREPDTLKQVSRIKKSCIFAHSISISFIGLKH
jgi:hypothetical protein